MPQKNKIFLLFGIFGPLFFMLSFTLQGFFRQNYSSLLYPISSLSLTENGWFQILTFIISGISIFIFAFGFRKFTNHKSLPVIFVLIATGLTASGFFSTDAVYGYPATEPFHPEEFTTIGKLHAAVSLLVFIGLPVACFITGWAFYKMEKKGWALYSVASGLLMIAFFFLSGAAFEQQLGLKNLAGLLQRLSVCAGFFWLILYARYLLLRSDFSA